VNSSLAAESGIVYSFYWGGIWHVFSRVCVCERAGGSGSAS